MTEQEIKDFLKVKKDKLREQLDAQGGRGVELANEIDCLEYALDALHGDLHCCHCEAKLC